MKGIIQVLQKMMGRPSCEEVNQFLVEYVDGSMEEQTRIKFDKHMSHCKCCGGYLDDYRATIELTKNCHEVAIPDKLADHTIEFLRANLNDA